MDLYPSIFDKAATYAFQLAEGQGFVDGNKRVAIQAALVFLDINEHELFESAESRLTEAMFDIANKKLTREGLSDLIRDLYIETITKP